MYLVQESTYQARGEPANIETPEHPENDAQVQKEGEDRQ
jgi:hypothetical protein